VENERGKEVEELLERPIVFGILERGGKVSVEIVKKCNWQRLS